MRGRCLFYQIKGRLYAYYLLLHELGRDFEVILQQNNLTGVWEQAMDSLREAGVAAAAGVLDGDPLSAIFASHLAIQGFFLKRALVQLKEVQQVLVN